MPPEEKNSKLPLIVGILLVVVLLAVGVAVLLHKPSQPQAATLTTQQLYDQTDQQASQLVEQKKYDQAISLWMTFLGKASDPKFQHTAASQIGSIYFSKPDYVQAEKWYKQAESYESNQVDSLSGIADCEAAQGNKPAAIDYYKKTIAALDPKTDPVYNDDVKYYQSKIVRLGGTP